MLSPPSSPDETIVPPLYCFHGRVGQQVSEPITGSHKRHVLHGALAALRKALPGCPITY
jgi:hypothetical protein